MDLLFAMLMYTVYNSTRLAGQNPKMEELGIDAFVPKWWTDEEKSEAAANPLADKIAAAFGMFGG